MIPGRIPNATRNLGAPAGWDPDRDGHCVHLPIQDLETAAGPAMQSVWLPTPEELDRLIGGAPITLMIYGRAHPPVMVSVGQLVDAQL
jgi:hypothetical protein